VKKIVLILFCVNVNVGFAQSILKNGPRFGIKTGVVGTEISGTGGIEVKTGFEGGAWLQLRIRKKWTVQFEILFVEKGTGNRRSNNYAHWIGLYYFEIPFLLQYHKDEVCFEFGPGIGYLASAAESLYGSPSAAELNPFYNKEFSFNLGIVYSVNNSWNLGCRYTNSIVPIRKSSAFNGQLYNRVFAITLAHQLKIKKPKGGRDLIEVLPEE
jgi:hypothetical protein